MFELIVVADNAKLKSSWLGDSNEFTVPAGEKAFLLLLCLIFCVLGVPSGEKRCIVLLFEFGRVGGFEAWVGRGGLIVGCYWECDRVFKFMTSGD